MYADGVVERNPAQRKDIAPHVGGSSGPNLLGDGHLGNRPETGLPQGGFDQWTAVSTVTVSPTISRASRVLP